MLNLINMSNKNQKFDLEKKKAQKVTKVLTPVIKSRILFTHQAKYNVNTKVSSSHNLVVPFVEGNGKRQIKDTIIDEKLQGCHTLMLQAFEKFLFQLDDLFLTLRTDKSMKNISCLPSLNNYKNICEKLQLEVLIAIDKLELTNMKGNRTDKDDKFLDKMSVLKSKLSQIRWEYHRAVLELNK